MDWRSSISENKRKTFWVILSFIFIYSLLGLFIDWMVWVDKGFSRPDYHLSAHHAYDVFIGLLTFKIIPYCTIGLQIIAFVAIGWTILQSQKMLLIGSEHHEVTSNSSDADEIKLFNLLEEMRIAAGMRYAPKLFLISDNTLNAFASGWSEQSAMIAVTSGLMKKLNRQEMQAVIAHELTHIRNQDIKLMLTVTVLSNIMMIVIGMLFNNILYQTRVPGGSTRNSNNSNNNNNNGQFFIVIAIILLRIVLPIITGMLLLYLSRKREFMADAGAVELTRDNEGLANALIKVHEDMQNRREEYEAVAKVRPHEDMREESYFMSPASLGIKGYLSISNWFSTHPTLEERLKALGVKANKKDNRAT